MPYFVPLSAPTPTRPPVQLPLSWRSSERPPSSLRMGESARQKGSTFTRDLLKKRSRLEAASAWDGFWAERPLWDAMADRVRPVGGAFTSDHAAPRALRAEER